MVELREGIDAVEPYTVERMGDAKLSVVLAPCTFGTFSMADVSEDPTPEAWKPGGCRRGGCLLSIPVPREDDGLEASVAGIWQ